MWTAKMPPAEFKLLTKKEDTKTYSTDTSAGYYVFCPNCGTMVYGYSHKTEWSEEGVAVRLACLDDMEMSELGQMHVTCYDGKADTWETITAPAITKLM
jgi:hypothetical protein